MRFPVLAAAVMAVTPVLVLAQTPTAPLTLAEAMRLAEASNPIVRTREAQLLGADGARREADALFFNNPELSVEQSRKRVPQEALPDERSRGWGIGVSQAFEIGGQQRRRREAAASTIEALRLEVDDARRQARSEAALKFHAALAAVQRREIERRAAESFDRTAQAVSKRRASGEDTRLDANVALVEAERARNAFAQAQEALLDARSELAVALGVSVDSMPEVAGELAPGGLNYTLEQLLSRGDASARQRALLAREDAARARLGVERAARYPDVTVGLSVAREGPGDFRERTTMLTVTVPIPLFKRNDAAIGQAGAESTQAEIERRTATRDFQAQVRRLWGRLMSQRERVQRLQNALLPMTSDNEQLAAKSRQAGQIGLLDQLLVNRQTLDAERELNEALREYHATRIELEYAAGWPPEGSKQ